MYRGIFLLAGLIAGTAVGVISMVPLTQYNDQRVVECRRQLAEIASWPQEDQDAFWKDVKGNPKRNKEWEIVAAIAAIPLD